LGCKSPEPRHPITKKTSSFIDKSVERNKALNKQEYEKIENFIKEQKEDYLTSENGFWYAYNVKKEAFQETAKFGDTMRYIYNVKKLNGTLIYSKEDLDKQTYVMDKEELFTGLRQGLKIMKPGETVTFIFPSQKAYGYYGDSNKITYNTPIICEVTLNSIN